MPALTPAYCRRYMREAHSGRRSCMLAASERCVGQTIVPHDEGGPFAYMELLTPSEDDLFVRTGELPQQTRLCELCVRHYVSFRWKRAHLENHVAPVTVNPHTHVVQVPGGYRLEACIQQVPGFADGVFGTFRHFDVSELVPVVERLPSGACVRGHDECASVFF